MKEYPIEDYKYLRQHAWYLAKLVFLSVLFAFFQSNVQVREALSQREHGQQGSLGQLGLMAQ